MTRPSWGVRQMRHTALEAVARNTAVTCYNRSLWRRRAGKIGSEHWQYDRLKELVIGKVQSKAFDRATTCFLLPFGLL